ncbi:MAG: response regulator [Lachnospiraceae bacterium]|nr:response regulator [Lachnospiraceae bacterium]
MKGTKGVVVLVSTGEGIIVKGIERNLGEAGVEYVYAGIDIESIKRNQTVADVYVIYLSPDIPGMTPAMNCVNAVVKETNIPLIVIGEKNEQEDAAAAVYGLSANAWMNRPLDMEVFLKRIKGFISEKANNRTNKKVLIVDDDPTYAKLVRQWLNEYYNISIVTSGAEAVDLLQKSEFNLVLLDYEMPEMNGPQVLEKLRSDDKTKSIPVFFLTGIGTKESVSSVMALKPEGYILKTATKDELTVYIERFFNK